MRIISRLAAFLLICVSTQAFADKYFAVTPSGAAEMIFPDAPATVVGQLSSRCIDAHWIVISSSSTELVCEAPLNMGQSILGQVLLGNSYSTPPRRFFRFNVATVNGISRVQASGWMELQMAFGQMKRTDFTGPEFQNSIIGFMAGAGGKYPVGTTFPNHVFMGFKSAEIPEGSYLGLRVTEIEADSPAAKAGLQLGDIVVRVAHKQFKNMGGYLDATAKAAETASYEIEILRDGTSIKLNLDRAFRPAFTEVVVASTQQQPPQASAAGSSVADELEKLAKLKAEGILTAAEFDAQKRKLLDK